MRVSLGTIDVPKVVRRAIRHHHGQTGLATRAECKGWFLSESEATLDDIVGELIEELPHWEKYQDEGYVS